jgi:hypothetical protein
MPIQIMKMVKILLKRKLKLGIFGIEMFTKS